MLDFLDDDDGDLHLSSDGDIAVVSGAQEVQQAGATRLRSQRGEYFLDATFGPDWLKQVLTKPFRKAASSRHLRSELLLVQELTAVKTVNDLAALDTAVTGSFEIQTPYGPGVVDI
jgi:hypothetical protein